MRAAASLLAGVALDLDRVLDAISRATAEGLACDWAAVAVREPDGRLVIAASTGRGAGWVQRWHLRADSGFAGARAHERGRGDRERREPTSRSRATAAQRPCSPSRCATPTARASPSCSAAATPARRSRPRISRSPTASPRSRAARSRPRTRPSVHGACRRSSRRSTRPPSAAGEGDDARALALLARVAAELARADAVLVRILDTARGVLVARAVHVDAPALEAELTGHEPAARRRARGGHARPRDRARCRDRARRRPPPAEPRRDDGAGVPDRRRQRARWACSRSCAPGPDQFSEAERQLLRHVAAQAALAVSRGGSGVETGLQELLDVAGEALSATGDAAAVARVAARLASAACRADSALLHALDEDGLHVLAGFGARLADPVRQGPLDALALEALRHDDAIVTGRRRLAGAGRAAPARAPCSPSCCARAARRWASCSCSSPSASAPTPPAPTSRSRSSRRASPRRSRARARSGASSVDLADARALCDAVAPAGEPSTQRALEAALRLTGLTAGGVWARAADGSLREVASAGGGEAAAALVAALLDEAGSAPALRGDLASDTRLAPLARAVDAGSAVIIPLALRDLDVGVLALLSTASKPPPGAAEVALRVAGVTAAVLAADEQRRMAEQTARGAKASEITARSVAVRLEAHEALADAALEGARPRQCARGRRRAHRHRLDLRRAAAATRRHARARRPARRGKRAARARRARARPAARRHDRRRRARARR